MTATAYGHGNVVAYGLPGMQINVFGEWRTVATTEDAGFGNTRIILDRPYGEYSLTVPTNTMIPARYQLRDHAPATYAEGDKVLVHATILSTPVWEEDDADNTYAIDVDLGGGRTTLVTIHANDMPTTVRKATS